VGLTYNENDLKDLVCRIGQLQREPDLWGQMSDAARILFTEEFTGKVVYSALRNI